MINPIKPKVKANQLSFCSQCGWRSLKEDEKVNEKGVLIERSIYII